MILKSILIQDLRNIEQANIEFNNRFNIIYGENGSGKTSLLEGIYLLSSGKSFRTSNTNKIVKQGTDCFTLFGRTTQPIEATIGLQKSSKQKTIKINGEAQNSAVNLAKSLPALIVTQDSHKLIDSGPQIRREFLDWGLFHVEHNFFNVWRAYRKLLKQRNSALSLKSSKSELDAWNISLAEIGETYSKYRRNYIDELSPYFQEYSSLLLNGQSFNLKYKKGWPKELNLLKCLSSHYERDIITGRTEYGPHRADFLITQDETDCKDRISRGQQKLLVYSLYLSQIAYVKNTVGTDTLLLLDDLGSELDLKHAKKLLKLLQERFTQVCITTANLESLPLEQLQDVKLFHVKHGTFESTN